MARADLHVHTKYSDKPGEWVFKKVGTRESYTEVEDVYAQCKKEGMDYVTITDHNTIKGALLLTEKYPHDTFTGVEITTGFPEDNCKIHLLVYDINQEQWDYMDSVRSNIYKLRDYIKKNDIAHSVAHATYAVNNKLSVDVLEKLILLFDVFEGINGCRHPDFNHTWIKVLQNLKPQDIDRMIEKHHIEPFSDDPWIKGITGGSDDHADLFIAKTYSCAQAQTRDEFVQALKNKKTMAHGRSNDYKSMAYIFYKIGYDFHRYECKSKPGPAWQIINSLVYDNEIPSFRSRLVITKMARSKKKTQRLLARFIGRLEADLMGEEQLDTEEKVRRVYRNLAILADDFIKFALKKSKKNIKKKNPFRLIKQVSEMIPSLYLASPFIATLKHLNGNRQLLNDLRQQYLPEQEIKEKKILWFTDTLHDQNGVSMTLSAMAESALEHDMPMKIVTSMSEEVAPRANVINLPSLYQITPDFYKTYTMEFPSLMRSLELIKDEAPTEVIISTPGPVGVTGLLLARLMGIKATGIYHTDFTKQMDFIIGDGLLPSVFESWTNGFYNQCDEVRTSTNAYIEELSERGLHRDKLKKFRRGIDTDTFQYTTEGATRVQKAHGLKEGFTMLYCGRISKDKGLDFLVNLYKDVVVQHPDTNLLVVGHGPDLEDMREQLKEYERVVFTDRVNRENLPDYYSAADVMVFPSTTETFGMVVLEAQACQLPVLVSNIGGCQEIVNPGETGDVIEAFAHEAWLERILQYRTIAKEQPTVYQLIRIKSAEMVMQRFTWKAALEDIILHDQEPKVLEDDYVVDVVQKRNVFLNLNE